MAMLRGSYNYLWDVTKPLGQGATSMVYKGRNKSSGEEVAVKVFSQAGNLRPMQVQMREFMVMQKLQHRNIVRLLAIEEEQNSHNKVIVMQLTDHGSLFNMLEEPRNAFGLPEEEFLIVFEHVSSGMKYLRDSGVVHRDIKPGNILRYVGEDGRSVYKLTDFGAAKEVESDEETFMSLYGTEEYLHPDMYERAVLRQPNKRPFTSKVDLWSLGVTFFHVATGQLPFKPFGGRKNKTKMFEITRQKHSGVIMGIQHKEGGEVEWSRDLPASCRLSRGLKLLITPIFAKLLESNPSRAWNFDDFFKEVDVIIKKKVIHVFSVHTWENLRVYINKDSNLTRLQELIAEQTDILSSGQLLIYDGQLLERCVQPLFPVHMYPEGISARNPVFCYNKNIEDQGRFHEPEIKDVPHFTSSVTADDYAISKLCAAIVSYTQVEIQLYFDRQELVRRAVHLYIHELYHECGHLDDYHHFLERNCDSTLMWRDSFHQTVRREAKMVSLMARQADCGSVVTQELQEFSDTCFQEVDQVAREINQLRNTVAVDLSEIKDQQLNKKSLKKQWNDSIGCVSEHRCNSKVEVLVNQIMKTKSQFNEDRRKQSMTFNDEQIHKYDKNRLRENCVKVKSLFYDHCFRGAKDQFTEFYKWYKFAWEVRQQSDVIEGSLLTLADLLEKFVQILNTLCVKYHGEVDRVIHNIEGQLQEQEYIALRKDSTIQPLSSISHSRGASVSTSQSSNNLKQLRSGHIRELLDILEHTQQSVSDTQQQLEVNLNVLHSYKQGHGKKEGQHTVTKNF